MPEDDWLIKKLKDNPDLGIDVEHSHPSFSSSRQQQPPPSFVPTISDEYDRDGWTQSERSYAENVLMPRLESGELVFWSDQVQIVLPGHTYTCDFFALNTKGEVEIHEVKGYLGKKGGRTIRHAGHDRSRVKAKFATFQLNVLNDNTKVIGLWADQKADGSFKIKEISLQRKKQT